MNKERLINEFIELVQIDSETMNEQQIGPVIVEKMKSLGMEVTLDQSQSKTGYGFDNVYGILKGNDTSKKTVFFTTHMDTVTPGNGIKPIINNDYIETDKTTILGADDKAGIAACFESIRHIQEQDIKHGDIEFVITVGEESGLVGAKAFDESLIKADFGYAVDGMGPIGTMVVQAPTQSKIKINIQGKKAHAGMAPEEGISAIEVASLAVSNMPLGRINENTTANIGTFIAEGPTNIVSDSVEIIAEARSLIDEEMSDQVNKMKEAVKVACDQYNTTYTFEHEVMYPSFKYTEQDQVVSIAKNATERIGLEANIIKAGGGSDGNVFSGKGKPTIILSVGYEDIHTTDEKMSIDRLVQVTEQISSIIEGM